jgi:hypothetical protein
MARKKAVIGLKGLAIAKVTKNDITGYESEAAEALPYIGQMNLTPISGDQKIYYDDDLYARLLRSPGEDVEIRLAEMSLEQMADLGLGIYDATEHSLEAAFTPAPGEYSLRCVCDTIGERPLFMRWRVFELNTIRFDNFKTLADNATVAEVIITGAVKNPMIPGLFPRKVVEMAEDMSNAEAAAAFIADAEVYPAP